MKRGQNNLKSLHKILVER